LVNLLIKLSML